MTPAQQRAAAWAAMVAIARLRVAAWVRIDQTTEGFRRRLSA
jgi:hypothetical protein